MPLLIAHNGRAFDIPFLHLELQRNSLALPENTLFFDTYRYAKEILPLMKQDLGSYSQVCTASTIPFLLLLSFRSCGQMGQEGRYDC